MPEKYISFIRLDEYQGRHKCCPTKTEHTGQFSMFILTPGFNYLFLWRHGHKEIGGYCLEMCMTIVAYWKISLYDQAQQRCNLICYC